MFAVCARFLVEDGDKDYALELIKNLIQGYPEYDHVWVEDEYE